MSENVVGPGVVIPPELVTTTRGPVLWGSAEITAFANMVAAELGKPPLGFGRVWTWPRVAGFPAPYATLSMGNVYLATEIVPWVRERMSAERFPTSPIDDELREAIRREKGFTTSRECAQKHGVNKSTVTRIWRGDR